MRSASSRAGLLVNVDSAGTAGWHIGKAPDERGQIVVMQNAQIDMSRYQARQVSADDFSKFDYIFAMDEQNLHDLQSIQPMNSRGKLQLLLNDDEGGPSVADPYYGDISDFETVWRQVSAASERIAKKLAKL